MAIAHEDAVVAGFREKLAMPFRSHGEGLSISLVGRFRGCVELLPPRRRLRGSDDQLLTIGTTSSGVSGSGAGWAPAKLRAFTRDLGAGTQGVVPQKPSSNNFSTFFQKSSPVQRSAFLTEYRSREGQRWLPDSLCNLM